ncbi:MFS transporter [Robertkochia aurantiaca]|uniref:MFS transporter n=1 Tax=Robertkochia aurantiaca TaxID=2873700 RepID=UPI001CCB7A22|nr:MFS transporter [Robertkochia sp. 3YJGBD-33]
MALNAKRPPYYGMILLVMLIFFVISFMTNILNSIITAVKDSYNLSLTATGFLPLSFFLAYGVMSIPGGFMAQKYSSRRVLTISFLIMTLAASVFVFFPAYPNFLFTLFVMGGCMAVLQVVINPLLRIAGGKEHFAFYSLVAQLVFGLASFLSPWVYSSMVREKELGWFTSWVPSDLPWAGMYALFVLISLVLVLVVSSLRYPKMTLEEDEKMGALTSFKKLFGSRLTWFYFFGIFAYVGVEQGVGNWISPFLKTYHMVDPQTGGAATVSYFWGMLTLGCLLGLVLVRLFDSRRVLTGFTSLAVVSLVIALYGSAEVALWAFPAVGFFISVMWSIIFSLALNSVKYHHGSFSGILCTGIAGGAVLPFIVGFLGEIFGLKPALHFLFLPLIYIVYIALTAKPLVTNKTLVKKAEVKS